jgi:hypothetical protein
VPARDVTIKVANASEVAATASLRLEVVPDAELTALGYVLPPERLVIGNVRLTTRAPASTLAGCVDALRTLLFTILFRLFGWPAPLPSRPLQVKLGPRSGAEVRVRIDAVGAKGATAVRVVDRRDGKVVGGVTILVLDGVGDTKIREIPAPNPCRIALAEDPYWLPVGADAGQAPFVGPLPAGIDVQLVAWIANPTEKPLEDAVAYLEHLGTNEADFVPITWNLGTMQPGDRFPLRWQVESHPGVYGTWSASIVVASAGTDPVRLHATYGIGFEERVGPVDVDGAMAPA